MPLCHDVSRQIKELVQSPYRSLITIDQVMKDPPSWVYFGHPYDIKNVQISEAQFIATHMGLGSAASDQVYTKNQFPIFEDLGGFKVTVLIRKKDGTIVVSNGESCPTALLIGLE